MLTRLPIAIVFLGWFVGPLYAVPLPDEPPKYKPIDPETVAAYEKLGAAYGGLSVNQYGYIQFSPGKDAAAKGLPGFRLLSSDGGLPKLPPVQVPFGLDLSDPKLMDAGLKELKELKDLDNLTTLDLSTNDNVTDAGLKGLRNLKRLTTLNLLLTRVTDAGLKELKDLKNLTTLELGYAGITDTGLKELKDLKNLTTLSLGQTKVTDAGVKELKQALPQCTIDLSVHSVY